MPFSSHQSPSSQPPHRGVTLVLASLAVFMTASQLLQTALGYSPLAAGLRLLPWTAPPMIIAPIAGTLADR